MDLKEIGYEFGNLILVVQDRDFWRALVNMVKTLYEDLEKFFAG
jgi:hypothetical protein